MHTNMHADKVFIDIKYNIFLKETMKTLQRHFTQVCPGVTSYTLSCIAAKIIRETVMIYNTTYKLYSAYLLPCSFFLFI